MAASFTCTFESRRSAEEMFDRARDIDLHAASQASAGERAVGGVVTGLIGPGQDVTFTAHHLGMRLALTSVVTAFDPPHRFVDEQVRGPFREFRHEHRFVSTDHGSIMIDQVHYTAPFGILGRIVERVLLTRYLRRLIEERGRFLAGAS